MKNEWPSLTVVVTTYNVEDFVDEALTSVINQTYPNLDILVVDDGSTDGTVQIVQGFIDRGAPVAMIHFDTNSPGGVAFAANRGIEAATSDFIGFLDGDDTCEPDVFERLMRAAIAADADVAMCDYRLFYDDDGSVELGSDSERFLQLVQTTQVIDGSDTQNVSRLLALNAVPWRKIYRSKLLKENNIAFPESDIFWEDNPFHWFVVLSAQRTVLIGDTGFYHRMNRVGQTMAQGSSSLIRMFEHGTTIKKWLDAKNLGQSHAPLLAQWAISQFEWISRKIDSADDFDTALTSLAPFVTDLDEVGFEAALSKKGHSSYALMSALRKGAPPTWEEFTANRGVSEPGRGRVGNIVNRAREYLKRFGVRKTIVRVGIALRHRIGLALLGSTGPRPTKKAIAQRLENLRVAQEVIWRSTQRDNERLAERIAVLETALHNKK